MVSPVNLVGRTSAEITELRLIHAHRPRYNRRSKPPKSSHWLKLTDEKFPRLSIVRTVKENGLLYLGPFRSRRGAETVMMGLWDATRIRRCTGRPGSRSGPCAPAQLGVALCPCDGNLPEHDYGAVVQHLINGVNEDPSLLLGVLEERMVEHSQAERFEEAGWMRDRHRALARAINRRRAWQTMSRGGVMMVERPGEEGAMIEEGRLVAAWAQQRPLVPAPAPAADDPSEVPPSVADAEEAHLVWQWLQRPGVRLIDAARPLIMPARPVIEI